MAVVRGYDYESVHGQRRAKAEFFFCVPARFSERSNFLAGRQVHASEKEPKCGHRCKAPILLASVERTFAKIIPNTPCNTDAAGSCARFQIAQRDKVTIYSPMDYATYIVKFRTAPPSGSPLPFRAILSFCALGSVVREPAMRWLFSGRNAKLETMNRILTDAARKRTQRIEELEAQVAQLEHQVAHLKQELEIARKAIERARELEVVAAQRADLLNEKDKELAVVRDALTERSLRIQELERTLAQIGRS